MFHLEFLQRADPGIEAVLRQAAGQEVDPRLFWSLSVHLFGIYVELLSQKASRRQCSVTTAQGANNWYMLGVLKVLDTGLAI